MLARLLFAFFLAGAAPAFAQDAHYLPDLMKNPSYRSAWANMVKGEEVPLWVNKFGGTFNATGTPVVEVPVGGETHTLAWICEPHNCGDSQIYVMFAPEARQAWGLLITGGSDRHWLGKPDDAMKAAIVSGVQ